MSTLFSHKNSVFQAQAAVFLLFRQFEAEIFFWPFLDYRENYFRCLTIYRGIKSILLRFYLYLGRAFEYVSQVLILAVLKLIN